MSISSWLWLGLAALAGSGAGASAARASEACALAGSVSAGAASDALVDLPFRTIESRIYLDVMVDGKGPFVFAVDTGASGIGRVDASLVAELGLAWPGEAEVVDCEKWSGHRCPVPVQKGSCVRAGVSSAPCWPLGPISCT